MRGPTSSRTSRSRAYHYELPLLSKDPPVNPSLGGYTREGWERTVTKQNAFSQKSQMSWSFSIAGTLPSLSVT